MPREVTTLRVNVFFATGIVDIAPWCFGEFELTEAYHSANYSHIKNSGKLTVSDPDAEILPYFLESEENLLPVHIYVNDDFIFNGYIRNNFTAVFNDNVDDFVMEVIDRSRELERSLDQVLSFEDYKICDTSNPDSSILHQLMYISDLGVPVAFGTSGGEAFGTEDDEAFGFYTADYSYLTDIDITIDYYFKTYLSDEEPPRIYDLIQELLQEAGYLLRLDLLGNPRLVSIIPRGETADSYVFQDSAVFKGFSVSKKEIVTDSVEGVYYDHELLVNQVVFDEETNRSNLYDCVVAVHGTGEEDPNSYPEGADDEDTTTRLEFEIPNRELIVAKYDGAYFDIRPTTFFEFAKTWSESRWFGDAVDNGVVNTSATEKNLIRMQVVADAIVQGDQHICVRKKSGLELENKQKIEFKYIYHESVVQTVVEGWLDNYVFGRYDYKFVSETSFDLGGYYEFSEDIFTNVVYKMKIIKKTPVWMWSIRLGYAIHYYRYEALSYGRVVSIDTDTRQSHITIGRSTPRTFRDSIFQQEDPPVTNPVPPYKVGDIWQRVDGNYHCITKKEPGDPYASGDWELVEEDKDHKALETSWNGSQSFYEFLNSIGDNIAKSMAAEQAFISELFTQWIELVTRTIREDEVGTGSTTTAIVLDAGASAEDDYYNGYVLIVNGEHREITDYTGSTKTATVAALSAAPSSGDDYFIGEIGSLRSDKYNKDGTLNGSSSATAGIFLDAFGRLVAESAVLVNANISGQLSGAYGNLGTVRSSAIEGTPLTFATGTNVQEILDDLAVIDVEEVPPFTSLFGMMGIYIHDNATYNRLRYRHQFTSSPMTEREYIEVSQDGDTWVQVASRFWISGVLTSDLVTTSAFIVSVIYEPIELNHHILPKEDVTYATEVIPAGGTWTPDRGAIQIFRGDGIVMRNSSINGDIQASGLNFFDGDRIYLYNPTGASITLYYFKF